MCAVGIGICVVWSVNGFLPRYQPKVKLLRSFKAEEKSGVEISTKDGMATVWSGTCDGVAWCVWLISFALNAFMVKLRCCVLH